MHYRVVRYVLAKIELTKDIYQIASSRYLVIDVIISYRYLPNIFVRYHFCPKEQCL